MRTSDLDDPAKRDIYTRFLAGSVMGFEFCRVNPRAAAQITYGAVPGLQKVISPQVAVDSLMQLASGYHTSRRRPPGLYGWHSPADWTKYLNTVAKLGQTKTKLKLSDVLTNDLVRPANVKADKARARADAKKYKLTCGIQEDDAPEGAAAVTRRKREAPCPQGASRAREGHMQNPLAGHTNSYHTYSFDEALAGIAEAGYRDVELSAVPGWTEHVDLATPPAEVRGELDHYGLTAVSLSAHSDLTTTDGLAHGITAVRWAAEFGLDDREHRDRRPLQSSDENEAAVLANIGALADAADAVGVVVALEIHGDIMASSDVTLPLIERIGRDAVKVNYDTANCRVLPATQAVDDLPEDHPVARPLPPQGQDGRPGHWNFPAPRRRNGRLRPRAPDSERRRV